MKSTSLLVLASGLVIAFSACDDGAKPREERELGARTPSTRFPDALVPRRMPGFNSSDVPRGCEYDGDLIDGQRFSDANGEHVILVSQKITEESYDGDSVAVYNIYGYCYRIGNGSPQLLWSIKDNAEFWCDPGLGLVSDIFVDDLDNDGTSENAFVYNHVGRCDASAIEYKLIMHSGATKYAIRGRSNVPGSDTGSAKNVDFGNAPKLYREWAEGIWEDYATKVHVGDIYEGAG